MNAFARIPSRRRRLLLAALVSVLLGRPALAAEPAAPPAPASSPVPVSVSTQPPPAPRVAAPRATEAPIAPDYSHALSPQQMTDAWNREMRRLGLYVPVEQAGW